jgi:phenylacetate-CoA ligase
VSATSTDAHTLAGELMSRTRWTSERLAAHQREQLNGLVRHAVTHSPYYRAVLGPASGAVSLRELPTLTKTTLMEHFNEIVIDTRLRRDAIEAHLDGTRAGELVAGHRVFATSGSTGRRGVFVYSQAEFTVWVAAQLRSRWLLGLLIM